MEQNAKLAESYAAQAVDMEAAAVARGAQARGVRFMAVKAISDESSFAMPPLDRFVDRDGHFCQTAFAASLGARPWQCGPRFSSLGYERREGIEGALR